MSPSNYRLGNRLKFRLVGSSTVAEPVTLPVHCAHCGKRATLQMSAWPVALHHASGQDTTPPLDHQQTWWCPWCHWENAGGFPDRIGWARKGHQPTPD